MSQNRAQIDGGANNVRAAGPGDSVMEQYQIVPITTVGAGTWTAVAIAAGIIARSGSTGAYTDTTDSADNILAAVPTLTVGDSFLFDVQNTVAFALTLAAGEGIVLGSNVNIAASTVRQYLMTCLSNRRRQIYAATSTNGSAVLTGLTQAQCDTLSPGMGVTAAAGIPANTTVLAVNGTAGTVTLSANATATQLAGMTFFPRMRIDGVFSATL